jgi:peptidoglycan hydrolase-like protein with peptidoglycan-binding domain
MRFTSLIVAFSLVLTFTGLAATTKSKAKKAPAKKAAVSKAKPKAKPKTSAAKSSKTKRKAASSRSRRRRVTWRNRQQKPTRERYKEIQQALIEKGYLKSEASGVWDSDTVAAMKHFQTDQNFSATGKITAASLIALGLGAKSAGAAEAPPLPGAPGDLHPSPLPDAAPPGAASAPAAP